MRTCFRLSTLTSLGPFIDSIFRSGRIILAVIRGPVSFYKLTVCWIFVHRKCGRLGNLPSVNVRRFPICATQRRH